MPAVPRYSVELTIEQRRQLKAIAMANERSVAAELRLAVYEYLAKYARPTKRARA